MAGKADLINSIADLTVDVATFEVLPFGLDPYAGGGLEAPESTSGALDPNGGAPAR
ncbi:MAG TPA: hypothetical protein VFJ82_17835 [Longimicrobium sp.]|nr:hypothetical protein [Longimicrobium sp.]